MEQLTDRELLERKYLLLLQILNKVSEIDNDDKQVSMNVFANILADKLYGVQ